MGDRRPLARVGRSRRQNIAGVAIAAIYDFYPIPGDDAHKTILYILALSTWASQMAVYYYGYRALHDHNVRAIRLASDVAAN